MEQILKKIISYLGVLVGMLIFLVAGLGNIVWALYGMYVSWALLPLHGWGGWLFLQGLSIFSVLWGLLLVFVGAKLAKFAWDWGH